MKALTGTILDTFSFSQADRLRILDRSYRFVGATHSGCLFQQVDASAANHVVHFSNDELVGYASVSGMLRYDRDYFKRNPEVTL